MSCLVGKSKKHQDSYGDKHYENLPMQYTDFFSSVKFENIIGIFFIFLIFLPKTLIVGTR